ncbi:ATP-binding protein [Streptomyces sp. NPDC005574]|uniref:ATP-binding protein n=1 Tax=Streptomyces sp. NPDC005574 TaxID=3156891 RepID=UPI0033BF3108
MTTTAVLTPHTAGLKTGSLLDEHFTVAPRFGDALPRIEDACRVGAMRRITAARLKNCGLTAMTDDVMLIVSELLTNALMHSGTTKISLNLSLLGGSLRITVGDGMPGSAEPQPTHDAAESGRGLALVEALVHDNGGMWGTNDAGATVWCTLTISGQ